MNRCTLRSTAWALASLCLLCAATRVAHILFERHQQGRAKREHEPFESERIAANLVGGQGYTYYYALPDKRMPTANAPPGIVFVLAGIYATGATEPELWFRLLQTATAPLALLLTWLLARRAFDSPTAWLAAVLFVLDVNLSYTTVWVQETALNVLFTLAGLWGIVCLHDRPSVSRAALTGAAFGCGMLVRPTVGAIMVVALLWLTFQWLKGRARGVSQRGARNAECGSSVSETAPSSAFRVPRCALRAAHLLVLIASTCLVLAPWTLRNALVFGRFIPVSQNLGLSLWYGNNPKATGSQVDAQGRDLVPEGELRERIRIAGSEVEIDRAYREAALQFIREHPLQAAALRLRCFAYYWLDHNYWLATPRYAVPWWLKAGNIALVALFAVAAVFNARRPGVPRLLLLAVAASCLTYTMIHADVGNRYRMQIEPILLIHVAALCVSVVRNRTAAWTPRGGTARKHAHRPR